MNKTARQYAEEVVYRSGLTIRLQLGQPCQHIDLLTVASSREAELMEYALLRRIEDVVTKALARRTT